MRTPAIAGRGRQGDCGDRGAGNPRDAVYAGRSRCGSGGGIFGGCGSLKRKPLTTKDTKKHKRKKKNPKRIAQPETNNQQPEAHKSTEDTGPCTTRDQEREAATSYATTASLLRIRRRPEDARVF